MCGVGTMCGVCDGFTTRDREQASWVLLFGCFYQEKEPKRGK